MEKPSEVKLAQITLTQREWEILFPMFQFGCATFFENPVIFVYVKKLLNSLNIQPYEVNELQNKIGRLGQAAFEVEIIDLKNL